MTTLDGNSTITVSGGGEVDVLHVTPADFKPSTVAHGLSHKCRFGGFTLPFYSVAQHCVLVSTLCESHPLEALLHEMDEVFLPDIPRPVKQYMPQEWHNLALDHHMTGCRAFGIHHEVPEEVHAADRVALYLEAQNFMTPALAEDIAVNFGIETFEVTITPLTPGQAYQLFMQRLNEVWDGSATTRLSN